MKYIESYFFYTHLIRKKNISRFKNKNLNRSEFFKDRTDFFHQN